jgi:hypothetical protein
MTVCARLGLELELEIEGYYERAEPDVGIMSGGWVAEEIVGLNVETSVYDRASQRMVPRRVNLLEGVNLRSADVQRLLANIFDTIDPGTAAEALADCAA